MSEYRSPSGEPGPPFGGDATTRTRTVTAPTGWLGREQPPPAPRRVSLLRRLLRWGVRLVVVYAVLVGALILAYRFVNPPTTTLILGQRLAGVEIDRTWVPLARVSPHLLRAVIVSEDGQFCRHRGVDWRELAAVLESVQDGGSGRGGSTISMQVTKNLFLWPSKSYLRKALEIPLTLAMEAWWPKTRVMEVYLNIAEWGPGIFGAEAASRHHFGKPAAQLSEWEAALLAVSLPNPFDREAGDPGPGTQRLAERVQARMRAIEARAACVVGKGR